MRISVKKVILVTLVACVCSVSGLGFAQTNVNNEKKLKGKWILENVFAFEKSMQKTPFSADGTIYVHSFNVVNPPTLYGGFEPYINMQNSNSFNNDYSNIKMSK